MRKKLRESEGSRATLLLIVGGMLALAVWASMTPANARGFCGNYGVPGIYCHCIRQCGRDARHERARALNLLNRLACNLSS
jgi:hypothetical protein